MLCVGLALSFPFLVGGCKDNDDAGAGNRKVLLSINTALVNKVTSRAGEGWETDPERMHNLRVIIVDANGKVEYNHPVDFNRVDLDKYNNGETGNDERGMSYGKFGELEFPVTPNQTKSIYLFANAENLECKNAPWDWTKIQRQEVFPKDGIEALVLAGYGSKGSLPMSAVHQVKVGSEDVDLTKEPLYIVPVANKFTFTFQNERTGNYGGDITVTGWKLDYVADNSYLLPHVDVESFTQNKNTADWMIWMKENAGENETAGVWLTEYAVPEDVKYNLFTHNYAEDKYIVLKSNAIGATEETTPVYVPESQYMDGGEQKYTLTIFTQEGSDGAKTKKAYSSVLPNLGSLFRNTHVKVNVTFKMVTIDLVVDLYPYTGVDLDPDFGINVPTEGETETPDEQN